MLNSSDMLLSFLYVKLLPNRHLQTVLLSVLCGHGQALWKIHPPLNKEHYFAQFQWCPWANWENHKMQLMATCVYYIISTWKSAPIKQSSINCFRLLLTICCSLVKASWKCILEVALYLPSTDSSEWETFKTNPYSDLMMK